MAEVEGAEAGVDSLEEELGHAGDEVVAGVQQLDQGRGRHHAPWSHTWERCLRRLGKYAYWRFISKYLNRILNCESASRHFKQGTSRK